MTKEYYILAGEKGMRKLMIEKGINMDSMHLLIVREKSVLGKLIRKEAIKKEVGGKK